MQRNGDNELNGKHIAFYNYHYLCTMKSGCNLKQFILNSTNKINWLIVKHQTDFCAMIYGSLYTTITGTMPSRTPIGCWCKPSARTSYGQAVSHWQEDSMNYSSDQQHPDNLLRTTSQQTQRVLVLVVHWFTETCGRSLVQPLFSNSDSRYGDEEGLGWFKMFGAPCLYRECRYWGASSCREINMLHVSH